jgi:1-deoxy-D-xylulose-5-phosphate reductoisomerase
MAGALFMDAVKNNQATLLPIDSEHNAIFQCLPIQPSESAVSLSVNKQEVHKVLLTASGGPFREMDAQALSNVTVEQACAHPNWSMGRKISVDSASLMNKGLELIEACWLFDLQPSDIDVVVHKQSIIHSMVQYVDGTTLAQMGNPDMRTPITQALSWPERIDAGVSPLNLFEIARLDFEPADLARFPNLRLAAEAFSLGGGACAVLNAVNEVMVDAFFSEVISFTDIACFNEKVLYQFKQGDGYQLSFSDVDELLAIDQQARCAAMSLLEHELASSTVDDEKGGH